MRALSYIRVSTANQVIDGVSLETQSDKARAYCELHGLELVEICADEGLSGKRADNRPGLARALGMVCKMKGVLIVYSLSRLARSTQDCITIADRLNKCGAELVSLSEKIDTTSSLGRFFFSLLAALGQLEREQLSERTTAAMAHLRRQNRRISRLIPYGSDLHVDGKTLIPNSSEIKVIERMKIERAAGISLSAIAAGLNSDGIKPKAGRKWYHSSVATILAGESRRAAS